MQFTVGQFGTPVDFLDVTVYWKNAWHTKLFYKTTDIHAYLHTHSQHPESIFRQIPLGVAKRVRRICSDRSQYRLNARVFAFGFFPRRGYSASKVMKDFLKVGRLSRKTLLQNRVRRRRQGLPFSFPFTDFVNARGALRLCFRMLQNDPATRRVFQRQHLLAFKKGRSLREYLCKASLKQQIRLSGCSPCGKPNCAVDGFLETGNSIRSCRTGQTFRIRGHVSCDCKHVIYVVTCLRCQKQGVGECTDPRSRLQYYITGVQNGPPEPDQCCAILRHFLDGAHTVHDLRLTLVDRIPFHMGFHPAVPSAVRIRLENRWISKLDAELNVRRQVHNSFSGSHQARGRANP